MADQAPRLAEFLPRYQVDDNEWWRLRGGDQQNLFEESVELLEEARATIARVDALHQPRWITEVRPCDAHLPYTSDMMKRSRTCPDCARRPVLVCGDIRCCRWPCDPHLALHDETVETCAHAGEPGRETGERGD